MSCRATASYVLVAAASACLGAVLRDAYSNDYARGYSDGWKRGWKESFGFNGEDEVLDQLVKNVYAKTPPQKK